MEVWSIDGAEMRSSGGDGPSGAKMNLQRQMIQLEP